MISWLIEQAQVTWYKTDENVPIADSILHRISNFIAENVLVKQASLSVHLSRNCPLTSTNEQTSVQTNLQTDTHYCTEECAQVTKCGPAVVPGNCFFLQFFFYRRTFDEMQRK